MPDTSRPALFRSVDVAAFAATLVHRLRAAGVPIGLTGANRFSQALRRCEPRDVQSLYWVAKTTLIHDRRHFEAFDALFDAVFSGLGLPTAPWERDLGRPPPTARGSVTRRSIPDEGVGGGLELRLSGARPAVMAVDEEPPTDDVGSVIPERLPADVAALADTPFDHLSVGDLALVGRWLEEIVVDLPRRISRRHRAATRGAIDLRRTLREARQTGEPMTLARRRPRRTLRPVVMVADVSGSMEAYARIYLHVMRALLVNPDVGAGRVEVFTFTTSLRRVTVPLRDRDPQAAIDRLSQEVTDRFGGTRIATSLGQLLARPSWAQSARGATLLIASDGWDTDPPHELARRMARLHRMAHQLIWVNPRAAAPDYEPQVAGMVAALPYIDRFLSGHSLTAMRHVLAAMVDDDRGSGLMSGRVPPPAPEGRG